MLGFGEVIKLYQQPPDSVVAEVGEFTRNAFNEAGTPVLICAYNEEADLPVTLASLARSSEAVNPIVVDNGSSDRTAEFAEVLGATVIEERGPAKVFALIKGIGYIANELGKLEILFTDADTLVQKHWASRSGSELDKLGDYGVVSGAALYHNYGPGSRLKPFNLFHGAGALVKHYGRYLSATPLSARGGNMAVRFDNTDTVDEILSTFRLDKLTTEDSVLTENLISSGAHDSYLLDPRTIVLTRGDRITDLATLKESRKPGNDRIEVLYQEWVERFNLQKQYISE